IPKKHIASLHDLNEQYQELFGKFIISIPKFAKLMGLKGFKNIFNTGKEGGQMGFHLQAHI
ncbi:HIT domain-containing protein, partial [Francisella tularensis]|uniref:HIT domain-containing protein n=1 Tax=Francisella tularensis TaxID=263 RepID=UPI002381B8BD